MRQFLHIKPEEAKQIIADYINHKEEGKLSRKVIASDVDFELENIDGYVDNGQYLDDITIEIHTA